MSLDSPIVPYQIFVSSMNDGIESVLIKNERLTDNVLNFNVSFKEFGYNKLYTKEITSEASKSIDVEVVPFPLFEYSYIGCFSENTTQRVMNYSVPYQSSVNITENCVQKCSGYNFKYAGVSNSQCYCGDEFYSKIPNDTCECNAACNSTINSFCGGTEEQTSVYQLDYVDTCYEKVGYFLANKKESELSGLMKNCVKFEPVNNKFLGCFANKNDTVNNFQYCSQNQEENDACFDKCKNLKLKYAAYRYLLLFKCYLSYISNFLYFCIS